MPTNGSLTQVAPNAWRYTPNAGYLGSDSFTFKANDGKVDSNVATVNITVSDSGSDPSLVGWWKLDETSGTTAADSSKNKNDGTVTGGGQWVAGQLGQCSEAVSRSRSNPSSPALPPRPIHSASR